MKAEGVRFEPSGMFMLRAISRRPMPAAYAVLICSPRSEEIMLRTASLVTRNRFQLVHVQLNSWLFPRESKPTEKADHRAIHFEIKSRSGQRRASGAHLRARFASKTPMNARRLLIVKKREWL